MYNRVHIDPPPIHAIKCFGQAPISKATLFKRSCQKHVPDPDQTPFATVLLKTVPTSSRTPCGSPLSVTGDKPPFSFNLVQGEKVTISHSSLQGHAPSYLHQVLLCLVVLLIFTFLVLPSSSLLLSSKFSSGTDFISLAFIMYITSQYLPPFSGRSCCYRALFAPAIPPATRQPKYCGW